MKKVAIYARVSTEEQKKNYSIGQQIDLLRKYCKEQNWEIKEEYIDDGYSGANTDRPALKKMLLELNSFNAIVVWKLDRLSRSIVDTMTIIERDLLEKNIQFVALAENINTESPTWVTQAGIYSTIAQSEREAITERMKMGKLGRAKSGKPMAWSNVPFGYDYNKEEQTYDIVPIEADVVKFIFSEYERIGSVTKLRDVLNEQGHIAKDVKWSYRTVKQILENPVYKGFNRYKGELFKGNHEPLINEDLFDKVQQLMEERRVEALRKLNPRPFQSKYMLSGQLKCGYCGTPLEIIQKKRKDGTRNYRYQCRNRTVRRRSTVYNDNKRCSQSIIHQKEELEEYVIDEISKLQLDNELVHEYSQETSEKLSTLSDYQKQLESNQRNASKIINLYMAELIDEKEMRDRSKNLKSEENYLKEKIRGLKEENNEALEYLEKEKTDIRKMDYEKQKRVVEILIDKIAVKASEITIHWNF